MVNWRLAVNQAVDQRLLAPDFVEVAREELRRESWRYFAALEGEWPSVTDEIYLFGRMQRWAGASYSAWNLDRDVLAPFFHPRYVEWAGRLPDRLKRGSRTFVGVLGHIADDLASSPLESGVTPRELIDRRPSARLRRARGDARRAARKVRQRLGGGRHAPAGTDRLATAVVEAWRSDPPQHLASVPWLRATVLEQAIEGRTDLDTVTVAFLLNLDGAIGWASSSSTVDDVR